MKENVMRTIYSPIYFARGIRETLDRYSRFMLPGRGLQIPLVDLTHVHDVREHTTNIEPQPIITKDTVEIASDDVMRVCRIVDEEGIKNTFCNIDNWKRAAIQLAMTNLCQEFGELSPNESLVARETIAAHLQQILNTFVIQWGLTVNLPVDIPSDGNGRSKQGN